MKYISKLVLFGLLTVALASFNVSAATTNAPATQNGEWSFTLSGTGSTTTEGDAESVFGTTLSLGRTGNLLLPFEAGVRQSFGFDGSSSDNRGGDVTFSTYLYVDWTLIRLGSLELLAGGSVGLNYGNQPLVWRAAPEVETRLWLKEDVYVFGRASYSFVLNEPAHSEDTIAYGLGIGIRF